MILLNLQTWIAAKELTKKQAQLIMQNKNKFKTTSEQRKWQEKTKIKRKDFYLIFK